MQNPEEYAKITHDIKQKSILKQKIPMKTSVKKAIVLFLLFVFSASNISSSIVFGYEAYGIMLDGEENQYTLADNHDG